MQGRLVPGVLLLLLTVPTALAAEPITGAFYVGGVLLVPEGETLRIAPNATLSGPGRIEVRGTLLVEGTPGGQVNLTVPILVSGNGTARLAHARLWGVHGTALTVKEGRAELQDCLFEANEVGLHVGPGPSTLLAQDASFRSHDRVAARFEGAYDATWTGGTFSGNAAHIVLASGPGSTFRLADATLGPTGGASLTAGGTGGAVTLLGDSFSGGDVGLRVEGPLDVVSRNDTFLGMRIGVQVLAGSLELDGARFDTLERDIDAAPATRLELADVTLTPAAIVAPAPAEPSPNGPSAWWALLALALAGGGVAWWRMRPRAESPAPAPPTPAPPVDLTGVTSQELRLLRDVAAHPGTAQAAAAARLGMSRQALHYHVKKLEGRGLLAKTTMGRETRCTLPEAVALALSSLPATEADGVEKE